jgi:cysteine desulfurase
MNYFDYNATTPLTAVARAALLDAYDSAWENPSSVYRAGVRVKARMKDARSRLGKLLNVDPDSIVFCSGATEACNMWVRSFFTDSMRKGQWLLASAQEHSCMMESIREKGHDRVRWFSPHHQDVADTVLGQLEGHPEIGGVVMMAGNNETGICFPWQEVAEICRSRGIPFFCDTSQWIGKLPTEGFDRLDYFCASAHKFGGPKGIGFLKLSKRFPMVQGFKGGGQESGVRAGTEDYPSISAMLAALESSDQKLKEQGALKMRELWRKEFVDQLRIKIPGAVIHSDGYPVLWNTVSAALPGKPALQWIEALEERGFEMSSGAACLAGKNKLSHVLDDMGFPKSDATHTLRISSGWETTERDWQALIEAMVAVFEVFASPPGEGLTEVISIDSL